MIIPNYRAYIKATCEMHEVAILNTWTHIIHTVPLPTVTSAGEATHRMRIYHFDEIELMKYIQLKDINKNCIFEGDIVEYEDRGMCDTILNANTHRRGKVVFEDCQFSFVGANDQWADPTGSEIYDIEVIGNIYQNRKLLEVK